jgi:hypothetical protein
MLQEGVAWFGQTSTKAVTVTAAPRDAQVISSTFPTSMVAGQSYSVAIRMKNTGTNTWTAANSYRLGATGSAASFGVGRAYLPAGTSVGPGQEYTFTFTVTAPTAGTYSAGYRMLQEGVAWFGQTSTKTVTVS